MDKKTMNELADLIIAKLEIKQQQWDDEFHDSIADIYGKDGPKEAFVTKMNASNVVIIDFLKNFFDC